MKKYVAMKYNIKVSILSGISKINLTLGDIPLKNKILMFNNRFLEREIKINIFFYQFQIFCY